MGHTPQRHSPRIWPPAPQESAPRTALLWPHTGSTMTLRRAYRPGLPACALVPPGAPAAWLVGARLGLRRLGAVGAPWRCTGRTRHTPTPPPRPHCQSHGPRSRGELGLRLPQSGGVLSQLGPELPCRLGHRRNLLCGVRRVAHVTGHDQLTCRIDAARRIAAGVPALMCVRMLGNSGAVQWLCALASGGSTTGWGAGHGGWPRALTLRRRRGADARPARLPGPASLSASGPPHAVPSAPHGPTRRAVPPPPLPRTASSAAAGC